MTVHTNGSAEITFHVECTFDHLIALEYSDSFSVNNNELPVNPPIVPVLPVPTDALPIIEEEGDGPDGSYTVFDFLLLMFNLYPINL
jgi:hypothetical protein